MSPPLAESASQASFPSLRTEPSHEACSTPQLDLPDLLLPQSDLPDLPTPQLDLPYLLLLQLGWTPHFPELQSFSFLVGGGNSSLVGGGNFFFGGITILLGGTGQGLGFLTQGCGIAGHCFGLFVVSVISRGGAILIYDTNR
jgi:hypothetical protein